MLFTLAVIHTFPFGNTYKQHVQSQKLGMFHVLLSKKWYERGVFDGECNIQGICEQPDLLFL